MKKVVLSVFAIMILSLFFVGCKQNQKEKMLGHQIWMTENLSVDKFRNGDPIPHAQTAQEWEEAGRNGNPAWCYYNNDPSNETEYGKLYNWFAVNDSRGLAPVGWHIPSIEEWNILTEYLGSEAFFARGDEVINNSIYDSNRRMNQNEETRKKMKSEDGWPDNGNNESGLSMKPSGYRNDSGNFSKMGQLGYWWSTTQDTETSIRYLLLWGESFDNPLNYESELLSYGFSVRCVRNN
uniref:fibrobacter succinogenes major paralogous domain-containing protein n=1 Tax=Flavobacterium sp. TaxID=239 RepID=UPI00404975D9